MDLFAVTGVQLFSAEQPMIEARLMAKPDFPSTWPSAKSFCPVRSTPMDPEMIVAATATLLASKAGEGFADEVGRAVWERMRDLLRLFRHTHPDAPDMLAVLEHAESDPGDPTAVRQLTLALQACAEIDPAFADELGGLVLATRELQRGSSIVVGGNAAVGKIAVMGDVAGDVTF
jgi:hypothetical protein